MTLRRNLDILSLDTVAKFDYYQDSMPSTHPPAASGEACRMTSPTDSQKKLGESVCPHHSLGVSIARGHVAQELQATAES